MYRIKKDKYSKARGGTSKLFDIICINCNKHVCFYQKDGSGLLKRMYLDRIQDYKYLNKKDFNCESCGKQLGSLIIYTKENRLAYKLFIGAVSKRLIKSY